MALTLLTAEEMVMISAAWVMADEEGRKAIARIPLIAVLLPNLEKAHNAILTLRSKEPPNIGAISAKESEVDAEHDALVRAIYGVLTVLAPVSPDHDELIALRDKLFPEGLTHTQLSYRGEVGHAAVIAAQLDDAMKARLAAIPVHKGTLLDLVLSWLDSAKQLGQLEEERGRMTGISPSLPAEMRSARSAWIRMTKALMANARIAELDAATDQLLFAALRRAERAAESRAPARAVAAPEPPPSPAGTS